MQLDEFEGAGKQYLPFRHSSMLRETIAHNVDRGSPVHVVLPDTRKAFDQVWVDNVPVHEAYDKVLLLYN